MSPTYLHPFFLKLALLKHTRNYSYTSPIFTLLPMYYIIVFFKENLLIFMSFLKFQDSIFFPILFLRKITLIFCFIMH